MGCMPKFSGNTELYSGFNPDPKKFKILHWTLYNDYLLVIMNYPDCNNYEGNKILLYENMTIQKLKERTTLDPHFSDGDGVFPIARFEPTKRGKELGFLCMGMKDCEHNFKVQSMYNPLVFVCTKCKMMSSSKKTK